MKQMGARSTPVHRLLRLSRSNKVVLAEALLSLSVASLAIRLLPFRRTAQMMAFHVRGARRLPLGHSRVANQCRWAVRSWAARVPWRAVCFQKGLALHLMLRRRGIPSILHYGVAQSEDEGLRAHVWVSVGERIVIGGEEAPNFACVASFPGPEAG